MSADSNAHRQRDGFLDGAADDWFDRNRGAVDETPLARFDDVIARHLRPGGALLEIGCADGRRLRRLDHLGPSQSRLTGIEPSGRAVETGRADDPGLELVVGTADDLPFDDLAFDTVVFGFCLYLCDPALLPRIVAEADRVLADHGTLAIIDFDPPGPRRREYRHQPGLWTHKMDYAAPFLAYPAYSLAESLSISHHAAEWSEDESERVGLKVLRKAAGGATPTSRTHDRGERAAVSSTSSQIRSSPSSAPGASWAGSLTVTRASPRTCSSTHGARTGWRKKNMLAYRSTSSRSGRSPRAGRAPRRRQRRTHPGSDTSRVKPFPR